MMRKCWLTCSILLLACAPLMAGGFSIYEQGARSMGMASAYTDRGSDASTLFFNPAGMAFLEGTQVYGGVTLIAPTAKFSGISPFPGFGVKEVTKSNIFTPPTLFITHRLSPKIGVGFGGVTYSSDFITGGIFSLDGVHPNTLGYAITANAFIDAINAKYGSDLPYVSISKYYANAVQ